MNLVYDLDGVLRWLTAEQRNFIMPDHWDDPMPNGQSVIEYFNERPHEVAYSPVTPYYPVIIKDRHRDSPTILTHQMEKWIPYTEKWIHVYIPQAKVIYVKKPEEKLEYVNSFPDTYLVEDYPNFKDNSKVILISYPYNSEVKDCFCRIREPEELNYLLEAI